MYYAVEKLSNGYNILDDSDGQVDLCTASEIQGFVKNDGIEIKGVSLSDLAISCKFLDSDTLLEDSYHIKNKVIEGLNKYILVTFPDSDKDLFFSMSKDSILSINLGTNYDNGRLCTVKCSTSSQPQMRLVFVEHVDAKYNMFLVVGGSSLLKLDVDIANSTFNVEKMDSESYRTVFTEVSYTTR